MCQWPRTRAARVAGLASRSLVIRYTTSTVLLRFPMRVRRSCATWAAPENPVQAGASVALMAAGPPPMVGGYERDGGDLGSGQLLELPVQGRHAGLDGHQVVRVPGEDGPRGVMLGVHRVDRDDCACQADERLEQLPHGGDLV